MHIIKNILNTNNSILPDSPYFTNLKGAVIDIETTGLSPSKDVVFLIGVLSKEANCLKVTQFLASNYEEEAAILIAFFDYIKNFDILLNYNGTSFDIPFINKRSENLGLNKNVDVCRSMDYLRIFKASYLPDLLNDMKLTNIEKYAGVTRKDTLSGKECISLYSDFVNKNNNKAAKQILLHNFEDLSCFPNLNKLISKIDIHSAMYSTGFPVKSKNSVLFIQSIKLAATHIKVIGKIPECSMDWALFEDDFTFISDSKTGVFSFEIFNHTLNSEELLNKRLLNSLIIKILSKLSL